MNKYIHIDYAHNFITNIEVHDIPGKHTQEVGQLTCYNKAPNVPCLMDFLEQINCCSPNMKRLLLK